MAKEGRTQKQAERGAQGRGRRTAKEVSSRSGVPKHRRKREESGNEQKERKTRGKREREGEGGATRDGDDGKSRKKGNDSAVA